MAMMIKGQLQQDWLQKEIEDGDFKRMESTFRNWITTDGSAGPGGEAGFKAEPGRYHLYISHACPWAHRTVIFRKLKKLESVIGLSIVEPDMLEQGWFFSDHEQSPYIDHVYGFKYIHQLYTLADKEFTGQITVPVLWDKQRQTIVNNESSEIIRMLNSAFPQSSDISIDYYPIELREDIDRINDLVYENINNGVYRCGFATSQEAYNTAFHKLFDALDQIESVLAQQRYLTGETITEADWRLFTTLVRFDAVYVGHFKCNLKRIIDYHNIWNYLKELYQLPGIASTIDLDYIKRHYYFSHTSINPSQIIPLGPELDFESSHNRDRF
ncbi:MAG: glutathione S-transferase family protein [Gammaproteobacteria bacterium]